MKRGRPEKSVLYAEANPVELKTDVILSATEVGKRLNGYQARFQLAEVGWKFELLHPSVSRPRQLEGLRFPAGDCNDRYEGSAVLLKLIFNLYRPVAFDKGQDHKLARIK
jgi:hypothetical protein